MIPKAAPHAHHPDEALFAHFFGDCDPYSMSKTERPPAARWPAATFAPASRPAQPDISAVRPG